MKEGDSKRINIHGNLLKKGVIYFINVEDSRIK